MATKILKVKQVAASRDYLYALVEDGSVWQLNHDGEWTEQPAIEIEDDAGESED